MQDFARYPDVPAMLAAETPSRPVYCIFPHVYAETARQFAEGFPGRVLYAVKAGSEPAIIRIFVESGISHFDCASLPEIEIVRSSAKLLSPLREMAFGGGEGVIYMNALVKFYGKDLAGNAVSDEMTIPIEAKDW